MEGIFELLLNFAPRFLVCCLFAVAAVLLVAWLLPDSRVKTYALLLIGVLGLMIGIFWEIYARRKKPRSS